MTRIDALNYVLEHFDTTDTEVLTTITKIRDQLAKSQVVTEEKAAHRNSVNKEKRAIARAKEMEVFLPRVRDTFAKFSGMPSGITVKELADAMGEPAQRVQYVLLHEMKDEVERHLNGRNASTYTLRV